MQQTHGHTLKAFDQDLGELRGLIVNMGAFAQAAIEEAMRCLVERDTSAAAELVQADEQLDELETEAERRVVELIALRAPMADDLRDVIAALKIAAPLLSDDFVASRPQDGISGVSLNEIQ